MQEKRQERERDHTRHTVEIRQLEHSLNSRERMYKERIAGLEDQVRHRRIYTEEYRRQWSSLLFGG